MELIHTKDILDNEDLLAEEFRKTFSEGDSVAVKLHYGELGNPTSLKPIYARTVVSALKKAGAKPFLFDSSTMYDGHRGNPDKHRDNAEKQGFAEETVGCPLVFTDDIVTVKTETLDAEVCKPLLDADGMVVLTHVKGHPCTGFGGAIKNLGMGGLSSKTKKEIHMLAGVEYIGGCSACGLCETICPGNIKVTDHPEVNMCLGCNVCYMHCPQEAFRIKVKSFDTLISEGASAVIRNMEKVYYINVMKDITEKCDCLSNPGKIIAPDAGSLLGKDIVAIDRASHDIIMKNTGKDIFKATHHKSALGHIKEAERLSMGSQKYSLQEA